MSNIYHYLRHLQYSFRVPSNAIAEGLFLGLLSSLGTAMIVGASMAPLMAQFNPDRFAASARQAEAKNYMNSMKQAQQAYYAEKGKFATTIAQLGAGIKPETQNYRYRIASQGTRPPKVKMTAQAKRVGLRSYTAAVFAIANNRKPVTVSGTCETDAPSSTPPGMPTPPKNVSGRIQCPRGSHRL